jgi:hypothetical protein
VLTSATVCQGGLTPPSLWWTRDLVESDLQLKKLVSQWSTRVRSAGEAGLVSVVVNPQLWSLMNYFERYEFLNAFGLTVQEFGYNLQLSDLRGVTLGQYRCQFDLADLAATQGGDVVAGAGASARTRSCRLQLNTGAGLRARSRTGLLGTL